MKKSLTNNKHLHLSMKGLLALFLCAFVFASCDRFENDIDEIVDDAKEREVKMFEAFLTPLNNSGVTGKAHIKYSMNGKFEVLINAKGLAPNREHPQYIWGFAPDGNMAHKKATCPPASAAGDDNLITLEEGRHYFGDIIISLDDELVPLSYGRFPHTGYGSGEITYYEMVATKELLQALDNMYEGRQTEADLKLMNRVIVLHGGFVKDGKVQQHWSEGVEYMRTLPVACGEIMKK